MKVFKFLLLLFSLITTDGFANFSLLINHPDQFQPYEGSIESATVTFRPVGIYMQTELFLTFNSGEFPDWAVDPSGQLEIVYEFELPEEAIVTESWLWINEQIVPAKISDLREAITVYEGQVERKNDPSVLFKKSATEYVLKIYPLIADGQDSRRIKLTYLTPVCWTSRNVSVDFPTSFFQSFNDLPPVKVRTYFDDSWKNPVVNYSNKPTSSGVSQIQGSYTERNIEESELSKSIHVVYDNPSPNGVYVNRYRDIENFGFYELALIPSLFMAEELHRQVIVVLDYTNSDGLYTKEEFLEQVKDGLIKQLHDQDQIHVLLAGSDAQITSSWITADSSSIASHFANLNLEDLDTPFLISAISKAQDYLESENAINGTILLISNSGEYNSESSAEYVIDSYANKPRHPKISIIDLAKNQSKYWVDGFQYQGNEYVYQELASTFGGYFSESLDGKVSISGAMRDGLIELGPDLFTFYVNTDVADFGRTFGAYQVQATASQSYDQAFMQVGKFVKDTTFVVKITLERENGDLEFLGFGLNDVISDVQSDTIVRKYWAAQRVRELTIDAEKGDEDAIGSIVEFSLRESFITSYTAFLALEPEDTNNVVCLNCEDPDITGITDGLGNLSISVFPNPVDEFLNLNFDQSNFHVQRIQIYNLLGDLILEFEVNTQEDQFSFDLSSLHSGMYEIQVVGKYSNQTLRFQKL